MRFLSVLSVLLFSGYVHAQVKDNSFLIEEAYNQEAGFVQFIQAYQYMDPAKSWNYSFTNEIPIKDETQVGDILLNYRYQLMNTEKLAIAPRFSLIAPTGDYKKGFGTGVVGFQFNQAVSITLSDRWTNHWNAGFTYTPNAKDTAGNTASLLGVNFGSSIIYNMTPKTNL